jgi:hypothetical protein
VQTKLSEVKAELRRCLHDPIPAVGAWLRQVVDGHVRYYGAPIKTLEARRSPCFGSRSAGLAPCACTAQSHGARLLGTDAPAHRAVAAPCAYLSPLSPEATWRRHLRQEPDAESRSSGSVEGVTTIVISTPLSVGRSIAWPGDYSTSPPGLPKSQIKFITVGNRLGTSRS